MIYPIQFGIPETKIIDHVPEKTTLMAPLIPGKPGTYIYNTEDSYYKMYQDSIFGLTFKKSGWDCLRHYEILANGCIPFFPDLERCPKNTMVFFPKAHILNIMEIHMAPGFNYKKAIEFLLDYTRKNLTTRAIATYMLRKSGNEHATSALYLGGDLPCDYLRSTVIHGFKLLFGKNCHDFHSYDCMYTDFPESKLHPKTKGLTITRLLDRAEMRDATRDATIESDIRNRRYDIVIMDVHLQPPYVELVKQHYPPNCILYTCGVDIQANRACSKHEPAAESPFFWREIPDY